MIFGLSLRKSQPRGAGSALPRPTRGYHSAQPNPLGVTTGCGTEPSRLRSTSQPSSQNLLRKLPCQGLAVARDPRTPIRAP
jgi:hypothetical protein